MTKYFKNKIQVTCKYDCSNKDTSFKIKKGKSYNVIGIHTYKNRKHFIILEKNKEITWGIDRFKRIDIKGFL